MQQEQNKSKEYLKFWKIVTMYRNAYHQFSHKSYAYKIKITWIMTPYFLVVLLPTSVEAYWLNLPRTDLWNSWLKYPGKERIKLLSQGSWHFAGCHSQITIEALFRFMGFSANKCTLEQIFVQVFVFYSLSIIPSLFHAYSFICHHRCVGLIYTSSERS